LVLKTPLPRCNLRLPDLIMKHVRFLRCLFWLAIAVANATAGSVGTQPSIRLVESGRSSCAIVYPDGCDLSARTAARLSDFLQRQTDVRVPAAAAHDFKSLSNDTAIIVLDGTEDHRLAATFGVRSSISSERHDAYQIKVVRREDAPPLVLALGKGPQGAKYAVYRLMREMEIKGRDARIRPLDQQAEPFIKTRSVSLFNVWGMPIELTRRHNTESWSKEELERYLDMYDFFGFNAIESHDRFNDNYLKPLFGIPRAQWRDKVQHMADYAHTNGQQFFLRIWGHVVMQTPELARALGANESVPKVMKTLCPNDPQQKQEWDEEIRDYYVNHYAGRIDHLIGHWCDPGVCRKNGCTFETPLQLQMELHRAFKARDPKFNSTFSLWYFDASKGNPAKWAGGGWVGYRDEAGLINAGILDKDVAIAIGTSMRENYSDERVRQILAAGHRPAVWTWYRADVEVKPSLHIHMHTRLGEYFKGLPTSAKSLEWHNIERNVHAAANTASYYVAGGLMWNPAASVDDLLTEFLTLTFGPENAPKIVPGYLAIENVRCHACSKDSEDSPSLCGGTDNPVADAATARAALAHLAQVKITPDYRPRVLLDVSPAQIITDLRASLEVIRDYADCRANDLPAVETAIKAGDRATATKLLDDIHANHDQWALTLEGRQESSRLDSQLRSLRKQLQRLDQ
jgi:hypothetical protein